MSKFQEEEAAIFCEKCPAGKFQGLLGKGYCLNNPAGKSVKSETTTTQETTITLDGIDMGTFSRPEVQLAFREKIAKQLGVSASLVQLGNISDSGSGRRRLAGGITFTVTITTLAATTAAPTPAPAPANNGTGGGSSSSTTSAGSTAAPPPLAVFSFAGLMQDASSMASLVQQVYSDQNMTVPAVTVTATDTTSETATAIVELVCPAGKYFPPGTNTSECLLCPAGKYQSESGMEICKGVTPCTPGMYVSREDAPGNAAPPGLCSVCPAGRMSTASDARNCTPCPAGEYQPHTGQVFCNDCPPHATTAGGAVTSLDCKCEPSFFMLVNGTWEKGSWSPMSRPQCQVCVDGADCDTSGTTVATLKTKPGYWRAGVDTTWFDSLVCDPATCTGGMLAAAPATAAGRVLAEQQPDVVAHRDSADAQCAEGQSGLMCSLCDADKRYARHMGAKCIKCGLDINAEILRIVCVLTGLCLLAWLVTKRFVLPLLRRLLINMTLTQLRKAIYKRQMKVKILLGFVQVGSRLQGTFHLKLPLSVKGFFGHLQFLEFFDVFSIILRNVSCAYPTDYYTKVYVQTIGPLAALGLLYIAYVKTGEPAYFDLLLFVSFVVYPSSSGVLIRFFDCYSVWPGGPGSPSTNYLLVDPSIKCTDNKWIATALLFVLPMAGVFVVGFPACYAKLVYGDRALINPKCPNQSTAARLRFIQNKVISSQVALGLALGEHYGLHLEAAELNVLFRHWSRDNDTGGSCPVTFARLLELFEHGQSYEQWWKRSQAHKESEHSTGGATDFAEPAPVLDSAPSALREKMQVHSTRAYQTAVTKSRPDKERWQIRAREGDDRAQRTGFLWKAYRPRYYWFEVFDMFRKFLLTGLPLILNNLAADSDELSLAVGLLASMLGMVAYAAASPFADQQDSLLMLPTQMQVTLVMVCGMLMKFVDGDPVGQLCIAFLVIASCLPILGFGVYLLWNPDFDAVAFMSGSAVVKILGPFLDRAESKGVLQSGLDLDLTKAVELIPELLELADKKARSNVASMLQGGANKAKQELAPGAGDATAEGAANATAEGAAKSAAALAQETEKAKGAALKAVQLAIELIMNPNLDPVEDILRLGGESAELVMKIVDTVKPLVETGTPDMEDIAEMVETLFEVCSGAAGAAAKHSRHISEMMALKGLAIAGVKKGHAIEKAVREAVELIGTPGGEFVSFGRYHRGRLPPLNHRNSSTRNRPLLLVLVGAASALCPPPRVLRDALPTEWRQLHLTLSLPLPLSPPLPPAPSTTRCCR
jgi:hypothetical protein